MTAVIPIERSPAVAEVKPERIGVLLVNLGTPDSADARGVRVYLKEFLSDPRVIEDQGLLWKLALNGVILRIRPRRKARDYLKIWNTENNESPLKTITRAQSEKLAAAIADHDHVVVDWAMRYGNPSIRSRIDALTGEGCGRLLVVPSRGDSMPYVVIEAAAAGIPMVAAEVGGIPEIFGPLTDALFAPNIVGAMAEAIHTAIDNPAAAIERARSLRERIFQHFSQKAMVDGVLAGYREAFANR